MTQTAADARRTWAAGEILAGYTPIMERGETIGWIDMEKAADLLIVLAAPDLVKALDEIDAMPCSMVNDADSLRHTIKTMQAVACAALAAAKGAK